MKHLYTTILLLSLVMLNLKSFAQEDNSKNFDLSFLLGVNIGATAPLPLPEEVRKIKSYNPKFNPQLGFNLTYNLNNRWGVGSGVTLDWKGMRVRDEVKYMYTSVTENKGQSTLTGYFVGKNMTNVDMTYLTVPIYGTYRFSDKWQVKLGIYAAKALSTTFDGNVSDGYIRIGEPTGQKQEIDEATFDFSDDVRDYDFGLLGGGEYRLNNRIGFYANLAWGLTPYFYSGSNPIKFKLRNIYGTLGITYRLK
ncbi:MAG: porin family protein [Dysgonomonas sp.]|nr:porin family protein [Dysgonomonas sp.]